MTNPLTHYPDLGVLGEELVAQWLQFTGWAILHRRWRSRCGEIDIIAQTTNTPQPNPTQHSLIFVEVKTRSRGNWDTGGLLAVTPQKQLKLCRAAESFLATYPQLAVHPCRFDVALVSCERPPIKQRQKPTESPVTLEAANTSTTKFQLGQIISFAGHRMSLQSYIPAAFDRW